MGGALLSSVKKISDDTNEFVVYGLACTNYYSIKPAMDKEGLTAYFHNDVPFKKIQHESDDVFKRLKETVKLLLLVLF